MKMKGTSSFLMKQIYLVIAVITIALVINQIISTMSETSEEVEAAKFRKEATSILETLLTSEDCLAARQETITEKIVSAAKLTDFQQKYSGIEPDCIKNYEYGYSVEVQKLNMTKMVGRSEDVIPIPKKDRDIVLILDDSESMANPETKINDLKNAAKKLVSCANPTDRLSIVSFGPRDCDVSLLKDRTLLHTPQVKEEFENIIVTQLAAKFGTPLISSLQKATIVLQKPLTPQKFRMVILFTDGKETCCDRCRKSTVPPNCEKDTGSSNYCSLWSDEELKGLCCCEKPCEGVLCDFAKSDLTFFKQNRIPIYTVFLGSDEASIRDVSCVSRQTYGDFYRIEETETELLSRIFCEIVGGSEGQEDVRYWRFGSFDHSRDDALERSVTVSFPILIDLGETLKQPGIIKLTLYKGELEELVGMIDATCDTEKSLEKRIHVSYPVELTGDQLCMDKAGTKICRKFSCDLSVEFNPVKSPGTYTFFSAESHNIIRVFT